MKSTRRRGLRERVAATSRETLVLVGLTVVLVVVVFANDFGVLTPDTKPEIFLRPAQTAARFASSWLDTPNLGTSNYNAGVVPVAALFSVLDQMGVPAWVVMRLWRVGLLLLAAWGARLLIRDLIGSSGTPAARTAAGLAAAVAYAANPYVIVGGGTTPTLLPYALLPWLVICWLRGFRAPGWRWAAAAALVLTAMSGLNAGVVPLLQLIVLVPVGVHALLVERHRLRTLVWLVARTGVLYVVLSAYWLVPAIAALGVGTSIAEATETTGAINTVNSFPEVLRGLGMWTLYGASPDGLFDPQRISYVTGPVVVALTFCVPVVAALGVRLSSSPVRLFGTASVLTGALVMVGTFPNANPSIWGRAVGSALEDVPGLIAFRTTNKAGAVLELGISVLVGLAAHALLPRLRSSTHRKLALATAGAIVAGSIAPALSGDMFWVRMELPSYWKQAAQAVNERPGDSRVLMVPGTGVPSYSWGYEGPDEIGPSLFRRPFAFRSASPSGGPYSANLLAEVDRRLYEGTSPRGTVSTLAEYIGAGDVVGRYDLAGKGPIGGRVEQQLDADPGLTSRVAFGPPDRGRGAPPATVRGVAGQVPTTSARVRPALGSLVVDGAGSSLPDLQATGLLDTRPGVLLAGALNDQQLATSLRDGSRVVLTDANGRREWSNQDPAVAGPLLPASANPRATRALFEPSDQTVAVLRGNATVEARRPGAQSEPGSMGDPVMAFDGDRTTGWQFGSFGSGVGQQLIVTPRSPLPMPTLSLVAMQTSASRITTARVSAEVGDRTIVRDVELSEWNSFPASLQLSSEPVSRLVIEVTGVAGRGLASVGFAEVTIPGIVVDRAAALPLRTPRRLQTAALEAGVPLAEVPVDVVLHRSLGDVNGLSADEPRLNREFTMPDARSVRTSGTVRLAASASDSEIDEVAGVRGPVSASSSSRAFHSPNARASMAFDAVGGEADATSAWVPGGPVVGEWISLDFPTQRLSSFTFTQGASTSYATRALVSVNDGEPFEVTLGEGSKTLVLPAVEEAAKRVRILLTERYGSGLVRVTDIGLPRVAPPAPQPDACTAVGLLDGMPIGAALGSNRAALLTGEPVAFTSCQEVTRLGKGRHRVSGVSAFAIDDLHLASATSSSPSAITSAFEVVRHGPASMDLRLTGSCSPCLVSSGQAFDERWTASVSGRDLGAPLVMDTYAAGWRVDAAPGDVVHVEFGPARSGSVAWVVSAIALLLTLVGLGVAARGRWRSQTRATSATQTHHGSTGAHPVAVAEVRQRQSGTGPLVEVFWWVLASALVWATVGFVPAGIVFVALVVQRFVRPASQILANAGLALLAILPAVWFLGSALPLTAPAVRLNDNLLAHQWGGLAIWMIFVAACVETLKEKNRV